MDPKKELGSGEGVLVAHPIPDKPKVSPTSLLDESDDEYEDPKNKKNPWFDDSSRSSTASSLIRSTSLTPSQTPLPAVSDIFTLISLMSFGGIVCDLYDKLQDFYKQHSKAVLQEEDETEKIQLCQFLGAFILKYFNFDYNTFEILETKDKTNKDVIEKIEISENDKHLIIKPKMHGTEFGVVIIDLENKKTWYVKIANSKDTMVGLTPKLQEEIELQLLGKDITVTPQILVIDENKGIIENPKPNDATDKNVVIMMTESSFDYATDIDSRNVTIPEDDKYFQKQFSENFLKLITGIVLDGVVDSGLGNWSFEYCEAKEALKQLTGRVKLVDTMSNKSEGKDRWCYPNLADIKRVTIYNSYLREIVKPVDEDNIFNKLLYMFKYTQSFKGQNSESYFMPYVLNGDALYRVFTSYCQEHQDEMMSYLINNCVIPFLDRVNNSTELSDEEKLDCFKRFAFIDNYCGNGLSKNMPKDALERIEESKEMLEEYSWRKYILDRKEQEEETERVLSR